MQRLIGQLSRIDGRSYPAYKDLKGSYEFPDFDLDIVHVQGDPFAAPTKITLRLSLRSVGLRHEDLVLPARRIGLEDGILRSFREAVCHAPQGEGSGKSGRWGIVGLGQEILPRTGCELVDDHLAIRMTIGLPAAGRRCLGKEARRLLTRVLPDLVHDGILEANSSRWRAHADVAEDQTALRNQLSEKGWVAFLANGAQLPRASGASDLPLDEGTVPWKSPPEWEVEVDLPNRGKIRGTAIPRGITLICGGGYHGKSTVLEALARGVYNHIPGDGREYCVSLYDTVAVRAEDGRSVSKVNISGFISNLPNGKDTEQFETANASGSTSQAANIIEALEMGSRTLLIDEDTSAANFMVRDRRMQELVHTDKEPITPFVDRVRILFDTHGVSTILVIGGSGEYFEVADQVIQMDAYQPTVSTERAKSILKEFPAQRRMESRPELALADPRVPLAEGFDPSLGRRTEKVRSNSTRTLEFGGEEVDVSLVSQLVDEGQTRTVGDWMVLLSRGEADGVRTLKEICEQLEERVFEEGLFSTTPGNSGDRVFARRFELAAAINRLRSVQMRPV